MNGSQSSTSASQTIPGDVDWSKLSPRGQAILRLIAIPHSEGWRVREIAEQLGTTASWVSIRLSEFRAEINRLS
jgi:DNA-binding NarL/FixJ family response regulator